MRTPVKVRVTWEEVIRQTAVIEVEPGEITADGPDFDVRFRDGLNEDSLLADADSESYAVVERNVEELDVIGGYWPCAVCDAWGSAEDHSLDNDEGACLSCQDIYGNTISTEGEAL